MVWGGLGYLADRVLGTEPALTIAGVVLGAATAFYIVYVRFGRDQ
jgi:F0F1-type ATP synthase assembly protein I